MPGRHAVRTNHDLRRSQMKSFKYFAVAAAFLCLTFAASQSSAQVACATGAPYTATAGAGTITPGTVDSGNHCDDCSTVLALPFPVRIYNVGPFNTANLISNGSLQFNSTNTGFGNLCLPQATMNNAILPFWDDLMTDVEAGCATYPGGVCGIFTSVTGTAPNRTLNIEWRAVYFNTPTTQANFEIKLHEANALFETTMGALATANSATLGVQRDTGSMFTQFACNTAVNPNSQVNYVCTLVPVELMGVTIE